MTAIKPARLRDQVSQLASHFNNPKIFVRELHELLNLYARHVYRAGQTSDPTPILPSYHVPEPVLRQVELELSPNLAKDPQASIELCDALWKEPCYEFRMLAAVIIGKIPLENPEEALIRIHSWSLQVKDKSLREALFKRGLVNLISKEPNSMINRALKWLNSPQITDKLFGIQVILATLENKDFENLPQVYGLLAPLVRNAPVTLRSHIIDIILNLVQRSPNETAFFLQQNIELSFDQDTAWFIRRCMSAFPSDIQESLRAAVRKQEKQLKSDN